MQQTTYIYKNSQDLKQALRALLDKGYLKKQLAVKFNNSEMKRDKILVPAFSSGDLTLKKTIQGLKSGMLIGATIVGSVVGIILLLGSGNSLYPIATFIGALFVGAVWGGTLGFLLGSLFPLGKSINIINQSVKGYFTIDVLGNNLREI